MKGAAIIWHDEELAWIHARHTWPRAELHRVFTAFWRRADVTEQHIKSLCQRRGWKTGRTGCFVKGEAPMNKGKKMPFNANSAATRFKPGTAPPNQRPLWSTRIGKDGYIEMKVPARNPHTGHKTRFMHAHRWNWEAVNGPLPRGMCLKSIDGNRQNVAAENWEAIPRAMLPRLSGRFGRQYDTAPAQLQPLIMATAKLEHAAREARKEIK